MPSHALTGRSIAAALVTDGRRSMGSGPGRVDTRTTAATDLSTVYGGVTSEVRSCSACAYVLRMYMHFTAYQPHLLDFGDRRTALALRPHHRQHMCTRSLRLCKRTDCPSAATARSRALHPAVARALTTHSYPHR